MERIKTISYFCSIDKSMQKAKCFVAEGDSPRPLLVALHTWGGSSKQSCRYYAEYCVKTTGTSSSRISADPTGRPMPAVRIKPFRILPMPLPI